MIKEDDQPPPSATGVMGGVPGGVPGGSMGGVIGGIIGQTHDRRYPESCRHRSAFAYRRACRKVC